MKLALLKLYLHLRELERQAGATSGLNERRMQWLDAEIEKTKRRIEVESFKSACRALMHS